MPASMACSSAEAGRCATAWNPAARPVRARRAARRPARSRAAAGSRAGDRDAGSLLCLPPGRSTRTQPRPGIVPAPRDPWPGAVGGGSMDSLSVGIIGAGWMAQEHRRVLGALDGVSLDAVCDVDRKRAEDLASGTGARVYLDWRDMLDREDLGALIVAVPPLSHREPAVEALTRGLPLYLEKPIARTLEDAAAIVEAAEAAGTVCAVGYQWHALDLVDDLRQLLEGEQIGLLVGTSIGPTQSRPWFLDRRAGGGNLLERGSHHLDLARAVGGDVVSVQAAAGRRRAGSRAPGRGRRDDRGTIMLELASGALAPVAVARARPGQPGSY